VGGIMKAHPWSSGPVVAVLTLGLIVSGGCEDVACTLINADIVDGSGGDLSGSDEPLDPFPPRTRSAEVLAMEARFDEKLNSPSYQTDGVPFGEYILVTWSTTGQSWPYYHLQIPLDGLVAMFEATGRQDYFELALNVCENMVAAADQDRDGDGHPEWDGIRDGVPPSDGNPDVMLYDVQASVAIARMARVILTTPRLEQHYGDRGRALADFVGEHIADKWLYTRNQLVYLRLLQNWSDRCSMMVRILVDLYAITGDADRRAVAEELAQQFVDTVLVYNDDCDCYTWPTVPAWDTEHTCREAAFIDVCAEMGIVFTDADLYRVGNTLVNRIWDGSLDDPRCTNYHTGYNGPFRDSGPWYWGRVYNGWIRAGRVHPGAQQVGEALLAATAIYPPPNPTVEHSRGSEAVMAFCGHLARNRWLNGQ
jgi:hypothetical protein